MELYSDPRDYVYGMQEALLETQRILKVEPMVDVVSRQPTPPPISTKTPDNRPDKKTLYFMTPNILEEFIERYRNLPCLWKTKSEDYFNRPKRRRAIQELAKFINTKIPGVDADFIKKRIEILRACFRKEWRKVKLSMELDSSTNDVHVPKLWYYENLMFLADQEPTRESDPNNAEETRSNEPSEDEGGEVEPDVNEESAVSEVEVVDSASQSPPKRKREEKRSPGPKRKQFRNSESTRELFLLKMVRALDKHRDEYDAVGKNVAAKLRKMEDRQRIHAERLISEVLYKGLMEQLSEETCLSDELTVQLRAESPTPSDVASSSQVEKGNEGVHFQGPLVDVKEEPRSLECQDPLSP